MSQQNKATKPLLDWATVPRFDIDILDEDHRVLVEILNSINSAVQVKQGGLKDAQAALTKLYQYTELHFTREIEFMRCAGFVEVDSHSLDHEKFKQQVLALRRRLIKQKKDIRAHIVNFIKDWIVQHIIKADMIFRKFLDEQKIDRAQLVKKVMVDQDATLMSGSMSSDPEPTIQEDGSSNSSSSGLFKNILVPLVASSFAKRSLEMAISLAKIEKNAVIKGVHINTIPQYSTLLDHMEPEVNISQGSDIIISLRAAIKPQKDDVKTPSQRVLDAGEKMCKQANIPYSQAQLSGLDYKVIGDITKSGEHDLLIINTHGVRAAREDTMGGVSSRLARHSNIDTLIIKKSEDTTSDGPIIVALDFSGQAYGGLKTATILGRCTNRPVIIASAVYEPYYLSSPIKKDIDVWNPSANAEDESDLAGEDYQELKKIFVAHMEHAKLVAKMFGVEAECLLLDNKPSVAIPALVKERGASILVFGKTGIHTSSQLDMGSVAENLLHAATCDLLISHQSYKPKSSQEIAAQITDNLAVSQPANPVKESLKTKNGSVKLATTDKTRRAQAENTEESNIQWDEDALANLRKKLGPGLQGIGRRAINTMAKRKEVTQIDHDFTQLLLANRDDSRVLMETLSWDEDARSMLMPFPPAMQELLLELIESWVWNNDMSRVGMAEVGGMFAAWQDDGSFLPTVKPVEQTDIVLDERPIIDGPELILSLFQQALSTKKSVSINIKDNTTQFLSIFEKEPTKDKQGGFIESANYLEAQEKLIIGPLMPPIGNIHIRRVKTGTLSFYTSNRALSCEFECQDLFTGSEQKLFKLTYPKQLNSIADKRATQRVKLDNAFAVSTKVISTKGKSFVADIIDIGAGGISFRSREIKHEIKKGDKLRFVLQGIESTKVAIVGEVMGTLGKKQPPAYHACFLLGKHNQKDQLENFIAEVMVEQKKKRELLFKAKR
ncbi:MAG: bacteriohemerythrin [Magnetococcales bacterium]|nr:bacteriohemerythrin [Magnetococcales bacterium]